MSLVLPTPEQQELIRIENNEDSNTRDKDLEYLKEWLSKQPHLPQLMNDSLLLNFLRGSNFSLEKAKKKLDMYFTVRAGFPEFFTNRDINRPELKEMLTLGQGPTLPLLTPDGKRICIIRGHGSDLHKLNMVHPMKIALMFGDIRLVTDKYGVAGDVLIFDAKALTPQVLIRFTEPIAMKKFTFIIQYAYPLKIKEIHIINAGPLVDITVNLVMRFLKEKLRKRVHVHTDLETLYEFVPREVLPEDYGGFAGNLSEITEQWVKKMEEFTPWFKEQENLKADESKRPGKPVNYGELFGLDGSFKQLQVD